MTPNEFILDWVKNHPGCSSWDRMLILEFSCRFKGSSLTFGERIQRGLAHLHKAGLITRERKGNRFYYRSLT